MNIKMTKSILTCPSCGNGLSREESHMNIARSSVVTCQIDSFHVLGVPDDFNCLFFKAGNLC